MMKPKFKKGQMVVWRGWKNTPIPIIEEPYCEYGLWNYKVRFPSGMEEYATEEELGPIPNSLEYVINDET